MTNLWNLSPLLITAAKGDGPPVTPHAQEVFTIFGLPITNSNIFAFGVLILLLLVSRRATKNIKEVPSGIQNFVEFVVEGLENVMKDLLEPKVVRWVFPFIATFFIFILASNLSALLPGVGSIGVMTHDSGNDWGWFQNAHVDVPFFRPPTADANMTIAMALIFFFACWYWTFKYNGFIGTINHIFGPKGGFKGVLWVLLLFVFIPIGLLELVSISIRPVALAARLYGNIYGGENVLTIMLTMTKWEDFGIFSYVINILCALPFYFQEMLVAIVQTLVFTFLCLAFTATLCSHTDGEDHSHDEEGSAAH